MINFYKKNICFFIKIGEFVAGEEVRVLNGDYKGRVGRISAEGFDEDFEESE